MKKMSEKILAVFRYIYPQKIFIILGITLIFFIALHSPADPDMGWHLRDGKYLLENGFQVAKLDPFSYTMNDFPVVMHEWMTDWLMYLVYEKAGLFVLSIIFALISATAFVLVSLGMKAELEYKIIAGFMGIIASSPILGVRAQMISLLGLASVVYIIYEFKANSKTKKIFLLPVIFFVWANFHGGFPSGLFLLALFVAFETLKFFVRVKFKKGKHIRFYLWLEKYLKEGVLSGHSLLQLISVSFFALLLTFVNPYGWRIYVEVFTTIFDDYAKNNIGEWLPVSVLSPMGHDFFVYLVLFLILLFAGFRKTSHIYITIATIFLYLAFSSWRHMPIFLIISIPLWVEIVSRLAGKELVKLVRNGWFLLLLVAVVFFVAKQQIEIVYPISTSIDVLAEKGNYPLKAVRYLQENPIEGNMFNEYNWGGFLIWQYPEKKVYIDGRMPSWRRNDFSIFEEFNRVATFGDGWQDILNRNEVKFALVYDNLPNKLLYLNLNWQEVYSDGLAVIFVRPAE